MTTSDNPILTAMTNKEPLIILNEKSETPTYRMLIQTDNELPAYDMGLDKIRYNPDAIKKAVKGLEGTFIYDETRSSHNKRDNPELRGKKFGKVIKGDYCPQYGGFIDVKVFDNEYVPLLNEFYDSFKTGLPLREGPSTELNPLDGFKYGDNSFEVTDFEYNGIVWGDNHRDKSTGVCDVVNNSINELMEAEDMPEDKKIEEVKPQESVTLTIEQYETLKQAKQDYENLKPEDFTEYQEVIDKLETALKEQKDLYNQLVPVWTKQGELKMEMVNTILETIPEAEREQKQETFEQMDTETLETIVNTIPKKQERGVQEGGQEPPADDDKKSKELMNGLEKIGFFG